MASCATDVDEAPTEDESADVAVLALGACSGVCITIAVGALATFTGAVVSTASKLRTAWRDEGSSIHDDALSAVQFATAEMDAAKAKVATIVKSHSGTCRPNDDCAALIVLAGQGGYACSRLDGMVRSCMQSVALCGATCTALGDQAFRTVQKCWPFSLQAERIHAENNLKQAKRCY